MTEQKSFFSPVHLHLDIQAKCMFTRKTRHSSFFVWHYLCYLGDLGETWSIKKHRVFLIIQYNIKYQICLICKC